MNIFSQSELTHFDVQVLWNRIYEQKLIKNLLTTFGDGKTLSTLLGIRDNVYILWGAFWYYITKSIFPARFVDYVHYVNNWLSNI